MGIHGIAWSYIELHGIAWYCKVLYGIAMNYMVFQGITWYYMVLQGTTWYSMVLHGITWYCKVLHGIARYCMVLRGIAIPDMLRREAKSPGTKTRIVSGQRSGICLKSRTGIRLKFITIGFNNSMSLTGAKKFYNYMGFASQVVHWENFRRTSQFASVLLSHHHRQLSALKSCCRGFSNAPIANMGRTDPMPVPHTHTANIGWTVRHTPLGGVTQPRPTIVHLFSLLCVKRHSLRPRREPQNLWFYVHGAVQAR